MCCEGYDDEIITKCFRPYDNLTIAVTLNPDGKLDKEIVASMSDSLTMAYDSEQVAGVMKEPSLQMVSFTITEKGYSLRNADHQLFSAVAADMETGPKGCKTFMAQLTAMCIERGRACKSLFPWSAWIIVPTTGRSLRRLLWRSPGHGGIRG